MNKMREIILKINEGKTIDIISKELGMRKSTIRAMVDWMVHQGYLDEIRCGTGCSICSMNCSSLPSSKVKMYTVTGKGMECIKAA